MFNPRAMTSGFTPLVCTQRVEETADAASFSFRTHDGRPLHYKAGQFVVFEVDIADEALHRAYSLFSTPSRPEEISIAIKRVPGGRVSNHLLDHLRPGHRLLALPPAGDFNIIDRPSTPQVVLVSAGCGITPCLSIARWLIDTAPEAHVSFIHCARSAANVIMAEELTALAAGHGNFALRLVLSQSDGEQAPSGRLDQASFDQLLPDLAGRSIFTCGPEGFMTAIAAFAEARGFDMAYFHQESFDRSASSGESSDDSECFSLQAPRFGKVAEIARHQSLLEVMEAAEIPIVGACRVGVCGSCKCQVVAGEVDSSSQATLRAEEITAGYVLACSTRAKSDLVVDLI